jgi:hypothetical protein
MYYDACVFHSQAQFETVFETRVFITRCVINVCQTPRDFAPVAYSGWEPEVDKDSVAPHRHVKERPPKKDEAKRDKARRT